MLLHCVDKLHVSADEVVTDRDVGIAHTGVPVCGHFACLAIVVYRVLYLVP